jgi:signal recognition particle subunit SEC65
MGNFSQNSVFRKHTAREDIQNVQETLQDLEFMSPLDALAHYSAGYDPRKPNSVVAFLRRIVDKAGRPKQLVLTPRQTEKLYLLLDLAVNLEFISVELSLKATRILAEFMYPKQKTIESNNMTGVVVETPPKIARKAMKRVAEKIAEIY